MALFSMLFGSSVMLVTSKMEQRGESSLKFYYSRNIWLLVLGLIYTVLIWDGDVLVVFVLCSFVLYWFRHDNFHHYTVNYTRDSEAPYVTNELTIPDDTLRVPNVLPTLPAPPNDVGVLATWDIVTALDAGVPPPDPYVPLPNPQLYRGEHCAYIIHLYARDDTLINDAGDYHDAEDYWPVCIVNDLD